MCGCFNRCNRGCGCHNNSERGGNRCRDAFRRGFQEGYWEGFRDGRWSCCDNGIMPFNDAAEGDCGCGCN